MHQPAWDEIEKIYTLPRVSPHTIDEFRILKNSQSSHTKQEGNPHHYCSFFLPYDSSAQKIYLGHHIKADDYIPPGGHIEPGETPSDAAIREMQEELGVTITKSQLEPWNLSVKVINRPDGRCLTHYDVWHLVHTTLTPYQYDRREYFAADWFDLSQAPQLITKNPDFAAIIRQLA